MRHESTPNLKSWIHIARGVNPVGTSTAEHVHTQARGNIEDVRQLQSGLSRTLSRSRLALTNGRSQGVEVRRTKLRALHRDFSQRATVDANSNRIMEHREYSFNTGGIDL